MDQYDITKHVDYKRHMENFVSRKKCALDLSEKTDKIKAYYESKIANMRNDSACNNQTEKLRVLIGKLKTRLAELNADNSRLQTLAQRCPEPTQSSAPLSEHPEYQAMLRELKERKDGECTNPEVLKARAKLASASKKCKSTCNKSIEQHFDYARLMEEHNKAIRKAMSEVESKMKSKCRALRTDIHDHPDYELFKKYYEDKISDLQSRIDRCNQDIKDERKYHRTPTKASTKAPAPARPVPPPAGPQCKPKVTACAPGQGIYRPGVPQFQTDNSHMEGIPMAYGSMGTYYKR